MYGEQEASNGISNINALDKALCIEPPATYPPLQSVLLQLYMM
jgi:hypothetical protein